ncbi:helix-turn-helix transcriptional regulator [Litoreibacter janthinus]|uniref:Regulatory protein, luxR family n=1 Tax=Litoreibacter janthinus TaxID=670154 RepID=A0A1I6HD74_9RHOB|nr:helix-turn-helix transcriptional regulator [Litoreibacter janthinus]SFR52456.1 regulatory protein, luxR family [Litoreibacter janthinus]
MLRIWFSGIVLVTVVGIVGTFSVLYFVFPLAAIGLTRVFGLFALFFGLSGVVACVSFALSKAYSDNHFKQRLAPRVEEPEEKTAVILRNALKWGLSRAEADVAIFVAKGFSNSEIADMRGCAVATVKSQLGKIYQKSGLGSRYQLITFVADEVYISHGEPKDSKSEL